jgi:hypothetical protein
MGGHLSYVTFNSFIKFLQSTDHIHRVAISEFLSAYKVPLPVAKSTYVSTWKEKFTVKVLRSVLNSPKQTRELLIEMKHPGLMLVLFICDPCNNLLIRLYSWPAISFEADIVRWEFPQTSQGRARHHVKVSRHLRSVRSF